MNKIPNFAQRSIAGLLIGLFTITVFSGIFIASLEHNLTNRGQVQDWLSRPEVYTAITQLLTEQLVTENPEETLSQKQLAAVTDNLLTFDTYKANVDSVSNNVYDWLEGNRPTPNFELKLASNPTELRKTVVATMTEHINSLPECTADQSSSNLLETECRPPGFTSNQADAYLSSQVDPGTKSILETGSVSQGNLNIDQNIQRAYQRLEGLPLYFMITGFVLIALITLVLFNLSLAMRRVGMAIMIPSAVMTVVALVLLVLSNTMANQAGNQAANDNAAAGSLIRAILPPILKSVNTTTLVYAVCILLVGILLIIGSKFASNRQQVSPSVAVGKTK